MDLLWDKITEWLKNLLIDGITSNLTGMFDATNQKVAEISGQVGMTPQGWNGGIFNMIQNLSNTVIVPIAGAILSFVMTLELIQLITEKNNLGDVDTWMFFKWAFKSAAAVLIVTNTWNIVMGVFDAAQSVVASASGVVISDTSIDLNTVLPDIQSKLEAMDIGPLFGLWFQSMFVGICTWATMIAMAIFIVALFQIVQLTITAISVGLAGSSFPLQSLSFFEHSPYSLTIGQTYLIVFFCRLFGAAWFALLLASFSILFRRTILTAFAGIAVSLLPYLIGSNFVKYVLPLPAGMLAGTGYVWGTLTEAGYDTLSDLRQ